MFSHMQVKLSLCYYAKYDPTIYYAKYDPTIHYAKYDPTIFCSDLKKVPWDTVLSSTNVNEAWSL